MDYVSLMRRAEFLIDLEGVLKSWPDSGDGPIGLAIQAEFGRNSLAYSAIREPFRPTVEMLKPFRSEDATLGLRTGAVAAAYAGVETILNHLLHEIARTRRRDVLNHISKTSKGETISLKSALDQDKNSIENRVIDSWLRRRCESSIEKRLEIIFTYMAPYPGLPEASSVTPAHARELLEVRHNAVHSNAARLQGIDLLAIVRRWSLAGVFLFYWVVESLDGEYRVIRPPPNP
ncbi:MAG: hypothetical protein ACKVZJ_06615 [Phycisphaerales bacterium]